MMAKPLYENVGIGSIIRKIGECNCVSSGSGTSTLLTQQTPREDECRDLCIVSGSKIIVVDFKAPHLITRNERVYGNVLTKITNLMNFIGLENSFIGFLHGFLQVDPSPQSVAGGYYLSTASPLTTAFVSLSNFALNQGSRAGSVVSVGTVRLGALTVGNDCPLYYFNMYSIFTDEKLAAGVASIPCCVENTYVDPWILEYCLPCGSLCDITLTIKYGAFEGDVVSFSLARLLLELKSCRIGYRVEANNREKIVSAVKQIISERLYFGYVWLISYSPILGINAIPLSTRLPEEEW